MWILENRKEIDISAKVSTSVVVVVEYRWKQLNLIIEGKDRSN